MKWLDYLKKIGIIVLFFFLSQLTMGLIIRLSPQDKLGQLSPLVYAGIYLVQVAVIALAFGYLYRQGEIRPKVPISLLTWIQYLGYGFIAILVNNLVWGTLLRLTEGGTTANQEFVNNLLDHIPMPLFFLITVVSAPLVEELICRLVIPQLFGKRRILGLLIGSIVFALLHGPTNVLSFMIYFGLGLIFSVVYYRSARLEVSIGLHALLNGVAFLVQSLV